MPFKPFSLAEAIQSGQQIQMNALKLGALQSEIAQKRRLQQIAQESTVPIYGAYEQPEEQMFPGEAPIAGLEQQTGAEYSPEVHQEKLMEEGFAEQAGELSEIIGQMDERQRAQVEWRAEQIGRLAIYGDTEEKWAEANEEAITMGLIEEPVPFDQREMIITQSQETKDLLGIGKQTGTSEFERLHALEMAGKLTPTQRSRLQILAGQKARPGTEPHIENRITKMKTEVTKGMKHFSEMEKAISGAIAAMDSGDIGLTDTLMTQVMSQVQDTNVRAFQMYGEFDKTFGNVAERVVRGIGRFVSGKRTDAEKQEIRQVLENFREMHVLPGSNKMKHMYRHDAVASGLDPFRVVPPRDPEEIRDYPNMDQKKKIQYLKIYFPHLFR